MLCILENQVKIGEIKLLNFKRGHDVITRLYKGATVFFGTGGS